MLEFVVFIIGVLLLILWVSAFVRLLGLLLSAKDRDAFTEQPFLHVLWFGAAAATFYISVFLFRPICGPMRPESSQTKADLRNLEVACRAYKAEYDSYPAGDHAQTLQILRGRNARQIVFLETPSRKSAFSKQGELLDPWGTPYRFAITTNSPPVFISAGENRLFGDQDDLSTTN